MGAQRTKTVSYQIQAAPLGYGVRLSGFDNGRGTHAVARWTSCRYLAAFLNRDALRCRQRRAPRPANPRPSRVNVVGSGIVASAGRPPRRASVGVYGMTLRNLRLTSLADPHTNAMPPGHDSDGLSHDACLGLIHTSSGRRRISKPIFLELSYCLASRFSSERSSALAASRCAYTVG